MTVELAEGSLKSLTICKFTGNGMGLGLVS